MKPLKTIRNVQRFQQILTVLARHGFQDILQKSGLMKHIPLLKKPDSDQEKILTPKRLRMAFEELGTTFIKLGQILSSRTDLIPSNYALALEDLKHNVSPLPYEAIAKVIQEELGDTPERLFSHFEQEALAAASIAQVHRATLKDGTDVVIKVQRPGIAKAIRNDMELLKRIAELLEKYASHVRIFNPVIIVEELQQSLYAELDFEREAGYMQKLALNLEEYEDVVIPETYPEYSSMRVLTQEWIPGIKLSHVDEIKAAGLDGSKIARTATEAFLHQVFIDGLFHGDLHGSNLVAMQDNKVAFIDFGSMGRLGSSSQEHSATALLAFAQEDYELVAQEYIEMGQALEPIDEKAFQRDIQILTDPWSGRPLKEVQFGRIFLNTIQVALKHNLRMPRDMVMVAKAIITLEAVSKELDPHLNIVEESSKFTKKIIRQRFSAQRLTRDTLMISRDVNRLLRFLPNKLRAILNDLNQRKLTLRIHLEDAPELAHSIKRVGNGLTLGLITMATLLSSAILFHGHVTPLYHNLSVPGLITAALSVGMVCVMFIRGLLR